MKNQKMKETLRQITKKTGALVLATAIVLGGGTYVYNQQNPVPELVTYVDDNGVVEIEEDETPLAAPKVTKSTKTTKSTKKISLKSASARTYAQQGKTTTKKKTTKTKTSTKEVTTETTTQTSITNNYKKGSKINTQVTTVKTTVQRTETAIATQPTQTKTTVGNGTVAVTQIAPAADKRVLNAFQKLGFQVVINSSVPYSGECNTRTRTLTLKKADSTVYHELGHFLGFVAGNMDTSPAFQQIFANEKSKYTAFDKGYVLQNSSEYFAQSFQNYTENPAALKASRPQTYAAIQQALSNVTDARVANLLKVYGAIWNQ